MKTFNDRSRALKMQYGEKKDQATHDFDMRQTRLSIDIERLRNERSYWIAMIKKVDNDVDGLKNCLDKINEYSERIGDIEMQKCELDHERKTTINILKREYYESVSALEKEFAEKGGES
ncbi:MAG: hypothetical protein IKW83_12150 [Muribaculaceae bacterium]|nr:hypothetical protein [Muribaculaceae bacterium]